VEHGYGERAEVRRVSVDDLRMAVAEHRRIILLGEPGSGKTTTLWRLAYDYATAARDDGRSPLPLLVPLGGYTDSGPFDVYLARYLGPLASYLETYRASGRLILLLDGLNEMPQAGYAERVGRIREVLDRQPDEMVVVTCRALDYVVKLERLQKVEVSPLDETRIRTFLHNYLGETAGERLFWSVAGDDVSALWDIWQGAGGTWEEFWTAEEMPREVYSKTTSAQDRLWASLRKEPPPLLVLCCNPYMLLMTAQVYAGAEGKLPANRAKLFGAFVDTLLGREARLHPEDWIDVERQVTALSALAYAIQAEQGRGTAIAREWAAGQLCRAIPGCDAERLLYLATSATLLDTDETTVWFYHQLLQEYFAAREMGRRVVAGEPLEQYWPPDRWWEPSGWEETAILLGGMEADASALLEKLAPLNPVVAARCIVEGGAQPNEAARQGVVATLVTRMTEEGQPAVARAQAGRALAKLGDPRPGVGVRADGLPDIVWYKVPSGVFTMGSSDDDEMADDDDKPQHLNESITQGYSISRYPITNAQFDVFVEAGGYRERRYWTGMGWEQKRQRGWIGPSDYGEPFNLSNHPVVGVSWYEAIAFCHWLSETLRQGGELGADEEVTLPTEPQWEKAARGTDGRIYPWGDDPDLDRANYADAGIGTTSAVGCFPGGASRPYRVEDLSGNVWEWTRSLWGKDWEKPDFGYPYDPSDGREDLEVESDVLRVLRGGAFDDDQERVRCAYRGRGYAFNRLNVIGFRVIVASPVRL
jgi:formylglycine-generating enzyme required for sulfatase activity